ncbi:glycoside hydrolase superfamily, partial [Zopfochytrium polystomum]
NLLTSIAVGGYSLSTHFSTVAASDSLSRTFAQSIHQYMDENGFDGVDIDYEYPGGGSKCNAVSPDDAKNIVNFLRILRNELGADRLISFAISLESSPYTIGNVNYLLQYVEQVSFLGVMAYDVYSSWAPYSDISAPLSLPDISRPNSLSISTASGLDALTKAGVDKSKIVLGVPFYGHSWSVVSKGINNGLFQACSKPGQDLNNPTACPPPPGDNLDALGCDGCTVCTKAYSGMWFYFNLRGNNGAQRNAPLATGPLTAGNGWSRQYFDWAASPTLYNPSFQSTNSTGDVEAPYQAYISYEDPQSIEAKSRWAQSNGYAGIMAWEVSQDFQGELLSALKGAWAEASSPTQGTSLSTSPSASSSPPTSTGPSIPTSTPTTVARCAPDWATAQVYCGVPCPTKTDAECVASGT